MEMIDYSSNDDVTSIAQKSNVNLRRMSSRFDQRVNTINSSVNKVRTSLKELADDVSDMADSINDMDGRLEELIGQLLPVGICIITNSDPNQLPVYNDDMSWTRAGSVNLTNQSYDVWERTA